MKDWTKGGIWNKISIFLYGSSFHLLFYRDAAVPYNDIIAYADQEFDVTGLVDNPAMISMLYPRVDWQEFIIMADAWALDDNDYTHIDQVASILYDDGTVRISPIGGRNV